MARATEDKWIPWTFIEDLKNGDFMSTKYVSEHVVLEKPPKIIVFMNRYPDKAQMSEDRWNILCI